MSKTAILAIRIIGDATGAVTALEKVDGSAKSMQASMDRAAAGAGVALAAIAGAAGLAGNAASQAEQAAGAVDSVFKGYAGGITQQAKEAYDAVGLSESAYSNMAAILGAQLKNMGMSLGEAAGKTDDLIGLGADLSATFGGTTADAVAALSSLLRGERDPIERYGVSIKQADIDARLAAEGLNKLTGDALRTATTQATLALLTEQTADAQGQFARESDTAAGATQRAQAKWENAAAALGEQLLPYMVTGADLLGGLAEWMGENTETATLLAGVIGGLAVGILVLNGAMKAYAAVQAIQTAAQWASNAAWLASPTTWIILAVIAAIGLLVAAGFWLVENWDGITEWWNGVLEGWQKGIDDLIGWVQDALNWLGQIAPDAFPWLSEAMKVEQDVNVRRTSVPTPTVPSPSASNGAGGSTDNSVTNNITVNGAIDTDGTARKIKETLDTHDRKTGRKGSGGDTKWR